MDKAISEFFGAIKQESSKRRVDGRALGVLTSPIIDRRWLHDAALIQAFLTLTPEPKHRTGHG